MSGPIVLKRKPVFLVLIALVFLAAFYYFGVILPNGILQQEQEERVRLDAKQAELERQLEMRRQEEERLKLAEWERHRESLESVARIADSKERQVYLDCLKDAEKQYWDFVKLNGKGKDPFKPGIYIASQWVWEEAHRIRQAAIDDCERRHRLYMEAK